MWTPGGRTDGRWQPPKNMSGRRWYGDEANMEKNPYDAFSPERSEYSESHWQLSSGTSRHGVTGEGMNLLRDDTNLDEPDMNNKTFSHSPWGSAGRLLLHHPDIGWFGPVMRSRATWLVTQEIADKAGVSERTLRWANGLHKNQMRMELWKRQGKVRVNNVKDADALREELMKELAFERAFSPAGNGVAPGVVLQLSGPEFRAELDADTDVPLLVCVFNPKSALAVKFEGVVELATRRLLRGVRVVEVDGPRNADVARNLSITRFPTLVWLEPRTGRELGRLSGLVSAEAMVEKSKQLLRGGGEDRLLKSPEERPALAFHLDRLPMVDEPRDWGAAIKGTTSRHISNHKGSLCRSGQRR